MAQLTRAAGVGGVYISTLTGGVGAAIGNATSYGWKTGIVVGTGAGAVITAIAFAPALLE